MANTHLEYGIPDVQLTRDGGTINPSDFAGHQLLIVFCPAEREAAARELADYGQFDDVLSAFDTWTITVSPHPSRAQTPPACLAADPDGSAWRAFQQLADPSLDLERSRGAAFLFGRGGCLQRVWAGAGHAADVVKEMKRRA